MSAEMKQICMLHTDDTIQWSEYFKRILTKKGLPLTIGILNVSSLQAEEKSLRETVDSTEVLVLILSPEMRDMLSEKSERFARIFQRHSSVAVILCYTDETEFVTYIKPYYPGSEKWLMLEMKEASEEHSLMLAEIIELVERRENENIPSPSVRDAAAAHEKVPSAGVTVSTNSERDQTTKMSFTDKRNKLENVLRMGPKTETPPETETPQVVKYTPPELPELPERPRDKRGSGRRCPVKYIQPSCIHKAGEPVLIIFRKETVGHIQVKVEDSDTRLPAIQKNPYTYKFRAPEMAPGKYMLTVYHNGNVIVKRPFNYMSPILAAYECPALLAQSLEVQPGNAAELDKMLTTIFRESVPHDDGLQNIFRNCALQPDESTRSDFQIPTLLHFAADAGLPDLSEELLNTPGALGAFYIENRHGYNPAEMAQMAGHDDLAKYMCTFIETQSVVDLYIEMKRMYENNADEGIYAACAADVPGYLAMTVSPERDQDLYDKPLVGSWIGPTESSKDTTRPSSIASIPDEPPPIPPPSAQHKSPIKPTPSQFLCSMVPTKTDAVTPAEDPYSMGSSQTELVEIMTGFRSGEFDINEVERLYSSWKDRNKEPSNSVKERQNALEELRHNNSKMFEKAQNRQTGLRKVFRFFTKKVRQPQSITVSAPDPYSPMSLSQADPSQHPRLSTTSTTSDTRHSVSSSSSSSSRWSRDSALSSSLAQIDSDSDDCRRYGSGIKEVDEEEEGKEEATYIDEGELLPFLYSKPHKVDSIPESDESSASYVDPSELNVPTMTTVDSIPESDESSGSYVYPSDVNVPTMTTGEDSDNECMGEYLHFPIATDEIQEDPYEIEPVNSVVSRTQHGEMRNQFIRLSQDISEPPEIPPRPLTRSPRPPPRPPRPPTSNR